MAKQTGRFEFFTSCDEFTDDEFDKMRSPRFNFCIDFRVDSVPRSSLISVEPRY